MLKERKKCAELRELLGMKPVNLLIKKGRLRQFGRVEHKDDASWVKHYMKLECTHRVQTHAVLLLSVSPPSE